MDTFFTISALLSFYKIHKIYIQNNNFLSIEDVFKLYLKRYLRFLPFVIIVFFFGVYVMPYVHGDPNDLGENPLWYSF